MSDLSDSRPQLYYGDVKCALCGKPCDFDDTGLHDGSLKKGPTLTGRGLVLIQADCHGQFCNAAIPFSALDRPRNEVEVFGEHLVVNGKVIDDAGPAQLPNEPCLKITE